MRSYCCWLLLALALNAHAQKSTVQIFVTSKAGSPVTDLKSEELEIREPANAKVSLSSIANAPLCIGFLFDNSYSTRLIEKKTRHATFTEIENVLRVLMRNGQVQGFVLAFDTDLVMLQELTSDPDKLSASLGKLNPAGGTRMYDALVAAANILDRAECSRRLVVLVSDGEDNMSTKTIEEAIRANQVARVAVAALSTDETVDYSLRGPRALRKLTRDVGGILLDGGDPKSIKKSIALVSVMAGGAYLLEIERNIANQKGKTGEPLTIRVLRDKTVVQAPGRLP